MRKVFIFLVFLIALTLITGALAAPLARQSIYISSQGSDATGDGSMGRPYASFRHISGLLQPGGAYDILVLDSMTIDSAGRFYNCDVVVKSADAGNPATITRGDSFATQYDTTRGEYNPAMFESGITDIDDPGLSAALRFEHITLDDANKRSYAGTPAGIHDAMVAAYYARIELTLGEGTRLINFAGQSAVRATGGAQVVLASGSEVSTASQTTGKEAAVLLQSAALTMQAGAVVKDISGITAVKVDGGSLDMQAGALISNTANGIGVQALYSQQVSIGGEITGLTGGTQQAVNMVGAAGVITASGNIHHNQVTEGAVYIREGSSLDVYGKINSNTSSHHGGGLMVTATWTAPSQASMWPGAEINGNVASSAMASMGFGGGVDVQQGSSFTMHGGSISNNSAASGGGVSVRKGATFTLHDGEILNNRAFVRVPISGTFTLPVNNVGGGVVVWDEDSAMVMNGGSILGNVATHGSGVYVGMAAASGFSWTFNSSNETATLKAGVVQDITLGITRAGTVSDAHVYLSSEVDIRSGWLDMKVDLKNVQPSFGYANIRFGNASAPSIANLNAQAEARGYTLPALQTLWYDRASAAHFSTSMPAGLDAGKLIFALVQRTDAQGQPLAGAPVEQYPVHIIDGRLSVKLPDALSPTVAVGFYQSNLEATSVTAYKAWDNESHYDPALMPPPPATHPDIWLRLDRRAPGKPIQLVPGSVSMVTAADYGADGRAQVTWSGLPKHDEDGGLYTYSVVETSPVGLGAVTPPNYMLAIKKQEDGSYLLTNIYYPLLNGNRSSRPCQLDWYAEATIDSSIDDYSNHYFKYKVSCTVFGEESGYFAVHHWGGNRVGEPVYWRIPLATNQPIVNGVVTIRLDDPDFEVADNAPISWYVDQWRFDLITLHTLTPPPLIAYKLLSDPANNISMPAASWRPVPEYVKDDNGRVSAIVMRIPYMPAMSAYMFQFGGTIVNAPTPENEQVNYEMGVTFTADYNCVIADKLWQGEAPDDPTAVTFSLYADKVLVQDSARQPQVLTITDANGVESQVLRALWTELPFYDDAGKLIDYSVQESGLPEGWQLIKTAVQTLSVPSGQEHIKHYTFTNAIQPPAPEPGPEPQEPVYEAISVGFEAQKTLRLGQLQAGQFTFALKDAQGKLLQTVQNDAQGHIRFSDRHFSRPGIFLYTIEELPGQDARYSYDASVYKARVEVSAQGDKLSADVRLTKDGQPLAAMRFENSVKLPRTGDNILPTLLLLGLSGLALSATFLLLRRRRQV